MYKKRFQRASQVLDQRTLHVLYCSLVWPYLTSCAEVWGNNDKTRLHSWPVLQKRAMLYIHEAGYQDHTNPLFLQSKRLKLTALVTFQSAHTRFKAKNQNLLPDNIQKLFMEGAHNSRGSLNFKSLSVFSTKRGFCVSVCGIILWNSMNVDFKECRNREQFKKKCEQKWFEL